MKFPIMRPSPASRHFLSFRSKYSPQHPVFKHPRSMLLPWYERPSFTSKHNKEWCVCKYLVIFYIHTLSCRSMQLCAMTEQWIWNIYLQMQYRFRHWPPYAISRSPPIHNVGFSLASITAGWARWVGHVERMGKINAYKNLGRKSQENSHFERPKCRWEDNIKMDLRKQCVKLLTRLIFVTKASFCEHGDESSLSS
jgi:hypothetical protein